VSSPNDLNRTCYRLSVTAQPVPRRIPQGELLGLDRVTPPWPEADVLFTDKRWRTATVLAWCRYRRGWAALIRWADGTEEWRNYDPRWLRRSCEHPGGWAGR
jgi:hypothetical protein